MRGRVNGLLVLLLMLLVPATVEPLLQWELLQRELLRWQRKPVTDPCPAPEVAETPAEKTTAFQKVTLGIPISLNRETEEGLTAVPGIGPGLARAIVEKRRETGPFKTLEELASVNGIGMRLVGKFRPFLTP
jgi:competence ComEA-like helix-hairpin-helix protein